MPKHLDVRGLGVAPATEASRVGYCGTLPRTQGR